MKSFVFLILLSLVLVLVLPACGGSGEKQDPLQEAIAKYDKVIRRNPDDATAYIHRGNAYDDLDQWEKAIQDFSEAIRLNPEDALAFASRAQTYTILGLDTKAQQDIEQASSSSAANKSRRELTKLGKQAEELRKFDEKLRHYADMKIKLDLDDGVKVNYGKFGDLLAEVKAITGKKD